MLKGKAAANKIERYEIIYIKTCYIFVLIELAYVIISRLFKVDGVGRFSENPLVDTVVCTISFIGTAAVFWVKYHFVYLKGFLKYNHLYIINRITDVIIISFFIAYLSYPAKWAYVFILFPVLVTSMTKGTRGGLIIVGASFVIHSVFLVSAEVYFSQKSIMIYELCTILYTTFLQLFFLYLVFILFAVTCGKIYDDRLGRDKENQQLVGQLKEKYELLTCAQEEIKLNYEKLKQANIKLEEANKKLANSVAEFYTLQQISQAISSILNIRELLKYVNDIIIGVMGVNYSTIILYDEKNDRLKVNTTNITNPDDLSVLEDNINCPLLLNVLNSNKPIVDNFVDPSEYVFTKGREINSLICVPLSTKSKKFGLALIEHKYNNVFDESNARLLNIIGQQVGIALENAELYQKMQELAIRDGLTGVYNRVYFHERLEKEFNNAVLEGYQLSLAIFDIDFFKNFNDKYGHLFGDKVIKTIVERVGQLLRKSDILARFGGEEFIVLFPRTGIKEAYEKVESLKQAISHTPIKDELVTVFVSVSFGISCYPECASSEKELLRTADDALYEAKASGRNLIKIARATNSNKT